MKLNRKHLRHMIMTEIRNLRESTHGGQYIKGQVTDQRKANLLLRFAGSPAGWMMARGPDEGWFDEYEGEWNDETVEFLTVFGSKWDRAFGQTYRLVQDDQGNSQYHPQVEPMALELLEILENWHSGVDTKTFEDMSVSGNVNGPTPVDVDYYDDEGNIINSERMIIKADLGHDNAEKGARIRDHIAMVIDAIKSAGYVR